MDYATKGRPDDSSYRIPIGIQFVFGFILGVGLLFLPDSPRYFVKRGNIEKARKALTKLRNQPPDSKFVEAELTEIILNEEYERSIIPQGSWFNSWANCFKGSVFKSNSNLRKTILGTSLQMMQQWTGVNFIFYYSTPFLQSTGAISNPFLISLIFNLVNVCSTPISFYTVEKFGRRFLLLWGALGMLICQFLVAIIGVTVGFNHTHPNPADPTTSLANNVSAVNAQIAFIAIFIFFFASTWGPGAWVSKDINGKTISSANYRPTDPDRRSFPSSHPLPWSRSFHSIQLALEYCMLSFSGTQIWPLTHLSDHCRHYALHGECR